MPGRRTEIAWFTPAGPRPDAAWFRPIATGSGEVGCRQLCGLGHYRMRALFDVRSEADWRAFVADEVSRVQGAP